MRGTGSLQQLLGRSTFTSSARKRKAESIEASTSNAVDNTRPLSSTAADPAKQQAVKLESPLKAGFVRCPVCQKQLEHKHGDEYINTHLDKCLLKATTARHATKQQATMLLFAQKNNKSPSTINPTSDRTTDKELSPPPSPSMSPKPEEEEKEEENKDVIVIDTTDDDESWDIPSTSPTIENVTTYTSSSPQRDGVPQEQQGNHQQQQPPLPPPSSLPMKLTSCLVGRQFQKGSSAVQLHPGDRLAVQHEPNNPRDRNALLVSTIKPTIPTDGSKDKDKYVSNSASTATKALETIVKTTEVEGEGEAAAALTTDTDKIIGDCFNVDIALGHIPAVIAKHLGPLVRQKLVLLEAVVLERKLDGRTITSTATTKSVSSQVPLELIITPVVPPPASALLSKNAALATIQRAVHAAAAAVGGGGVGGGGGINDLDASTTSGERLRCNFKALVSTVCQHDAHVLAEEERTFLKNYEAASAPAQCLFLRLSQRAGPFFRINSLSYVEVPDPLAAAKELQKLGLVSLSSVNCTAPAVQWSDVAEVLPVPDLQAVLSRLILVNNNNGSTNNGNNNNTASSSKMSNKTSNQGFLPPPPSTRAAVLAALQRRAEPPATAVSRNSVLRELLSTSGPVLKILSSAYIALERFQRLFFLNEGHSLGQFLATDAGAVRYPSYTLTRKSPAFATRDHFLRYEIALQQAETLTTALEEGELEAAEVAVAVAFAALDAGQHKNEEAHHQEQHAKTPFLRRYDAAWVYCMMATAGVSILEKQKRYRDAADRLQQLLGGNCCPSRRGQWWLRLSTDLEHLGRPNDALEISEAALADESLSPGDRLAIQRRVLRLGKPPRRWKKPSWAPGAQREPREVRIQGRPLSNQTGVKSRFYGFDGEQCSVEELALQYYATSAGGEYTGAHTEGGIWATLFGLLLWRVLFSLSVPDAFRTPFQTAPLDLDSDGFYSARMPEIEAQLAVIANGAAPALIASIWEEHLGTLCRGVNWERWTLEELQEVASCVGGPGLAAVCRLLAQDHAGWQGGMPDLLLWHPERQEAKLAEVKGPRDRLSDQQRAWIAALEDAGLAVEVLKVVEPK